MYYVLGIECMNYAEVHGTHTNKKKAEKQAEKLEKNKNSLCCQRYEAITETETKKRKYNLYI
jgi:hypothetical protein